MLSAYLKRCQLVHTKRLLASSRLSTTRIGYLSGFGTRTFRRETSMSPDQFRRAGRGAS